VTLSVMSGSLSLLSSHSMVGGLEELDMDMVMIILPL
jgi:hypothetical protein